MLAPSRTLLALTAAAALTLTGCGGGTSSDTSAETAAGLSQPDRGDSGVTSDGGERAYAPEAAPPAAGAGTTSDRAAGPAGIPLSSLAAGRDIVRTASLSIRVDSVGDAVEKVEQAVAARAGFVASEQAYTAPGSPASAQLTLRVPVAGYDRLLADLAGLGTVLDRQQSADDVSDQVVDVNSRVSTAQASLARVRALLEQATSLGDIVMLEGELTRREADLESLQARQRALADQTALSTVTVQLLGKGAAEPDDEPRDGFLGGLEKGWDAFTGSATALLTALGAVLPFALLAAAVAALAWPVVRRRRRRRAPTDS